MGFIDSIDWKLTCPKSGATDTVGARQKGSMYSFSSWGDIRQSHLFDVVSKPSIDSPDLESATCKKCKVPAQVE